MVVSNSRILELASIIAENTAKVDEYLTANDLSKLSFEITAPVNLTLPKTLQAARDAVLDATIELNELLLGPKEVMVDYPVSYPGGF